MLVTLSGIVMLVSPVQFLKAQDGISVTSFGIVMDVASSLFIYNFFLLESYLINSSNPEILHHADISVIYMS